MLSKRPHALANILANWGAFASVALLNFFLSPFIVHHLGNSVYGLWAIVGSVVCYLGLLDLGVRSAVTRYTARYLAAGDLPAANRLTSSAVALFAVSGLIALALAVVVAAVLPHVIQLPPDQAAAARAALLIGGVTVGLSLLAGVFGGTIVGMQQFTKINLVDVTLEAARGLATWIVVGRGGGILGLALIQLGVSIIRLALYVVLSRRLLPGLRISIDAVERGTIKTILSFSSCAILVQVSGMVILFSDSIVIGMILPVSAVTFFMIGANLTEYGRTVLSGISQTLTPLVSATTVHHPEKAAGLLRRSVRLGTLTVLPILVTFLVRGSTFIGLWMGPAYSELSGSILRTLTVALCFSASYQMITSTMFGLNRHRRMVPVFIAEAAVNLALSLFLVRRFGILGVAIGTAVPRLIVATCIGPRLARHVLGIPVTVFAKEAWVRPMAAMIPFAVMSALIDRLWPAPTLFVFFAQVALCLPVAAIGAWLVALDKEERDGASHWVDRNLAGIVAGSTS